MTRSPASVTVIAHRILRQLGHWPGHGRALTFGGIGLLAAVVLAIGVTIWDLRHIAIVEAVSNTDNLAIVLAEQTGHSIQAVDIVLRDVQERVAALGVTTPDEFRRILASKEIYQFLRSRLDRVPQVDSLALLDADGIRVNNSVDWPFSPATCPIATISATSPLQNDPGLFISEPAVSRTATPGRCSWCGA